MYLPVHGFEPTSSVFLGESITHCASVINYVLKLLQVQVN